MSELDWFDFETRAKSFVMDLIEPLYKKHTESQQEIVKLKKDNSELSVRLKAIENILSPHSQRQLEELNQLLQKTRGELKVLETKNNQRWKQSLDRNDSYQLDISNLWASVHNLGDQSEENFKLIEDVRRGISGMKESVMSSLEDHKQLGMRQHNSVMEETRASRTSARKALQSTSELSQQLASLNEHHTRLAGVVEENRKNYLNLYENSASKEDFYAIREQWNQTKENVKTQIQSSGLIIKEIVRYLNMYLPIEIGIHISENLIAFMNVENLHYWIPFHIDKIKELELGVRKDEYEINDLIKDVLDRNYKNHLKVMKIKNEITGQETEQVRTKRAFAEIEKLRQFAYSLDVKFIELEEDVKVKTEGVEETQKKLKIFEGVSKRNGTEISEIKKDVQQLFSEKEAIKKDKFEDRVMVDSLVENLTRRVDRLKDESDVQAIQFNKKINSVNDALSICHRIIQEKETKPYKNVSEIINRKDKSKKKELLAVLGKHLEEKCRVSTTGIFRGTPRKSLNTLMSAHLNRRNTKTPTN